MDSKGFVKDPTIRIVPSPKFEEFLEKLSIAKSMPETLKNYLYNTKNTDEDIAKASSKHIESFLTNDDVKKIKSLIKEHKLDEVVKDDLEEKSIDSETDDADDVKDDEIDILKEHKSEDSKDFKTESDKSDEKAYSKKYTDDLRCLRICDLEWIMGYLNKSRSETDCPYLHELLEGCDVVLPENEVIKRDPVLEARCEKLRKEQSNRMYRDMTKNVDNVRKKLPEDTIAYQLKAINSHLVAILQFIFSVFAGFMFGFLGVEVMTGTLDFGFRLLLGVICGLIVALAEIYFLAKKLNEDLEMEENVQIGGPPVLPNRKLHAD